MAFSKDQQRDALIKQHEAWLRSQGVVIESDYFHARNITGEPSEKNRTYRASDDCWKRGLRGRTTGIAATVENGLPVSTATATVRVIHADGTSVIRSADSFRKTNIHKRQRAHATTKRDAGTTYFDRINQLGATGNVE